jgi:hypothetical protein
LKTVLFKGDDDFYRPYHVATKRGKKGGVYYCYGTNSAANQIAVVKLDDDLNVEWERYCLNPNDGFHWGNYMRALENGGVAVGGFDQPSGIPRIFALVLTDEGVTVPEMEDYLRPYCIYPNPCKDFIKVGISPDVTVEKIELFSIEGRMLVSQITDFTLIDTQNLPPATYLMKIILSNGKTYTEKIMKE